MLEWVGHLVTRRRRVLTYIEREIGEVVQDALSPIHDRDRFRCGYSNHSQGLQTATQCVLAGHMPSWEIIISCDLTGSFPYLLKVLIDRRRCQEFS